VTTTPSSETTKPLPPPIASAGTSRQGRRVAGFTGTTTAVGAASYAKHRRCGCRGKRFGAHITHLLAA